MVRDPEAFGAGSNPVPAPTRRKNILKMRQAVAILTT